MSETTEQKPASPALVRNMIENAMQRAWRMGFDSGHRLGRLEAQQEERTRIDARNDAERLIAEFIAPVLPAPPESP